MQWQAWLNDASPGDGELRDIAVARLQECLHSGNTVLDLSHLHLRTLPEILPLHLTTLILNGNPLLHLPENMSIEIVGEQESQPLLTGRNIRIMAEEAQALQTQHEFQPKISAKGAAIAAGATLLAGAGSWFYYRNTTRHTPAEATKQHSLFPHELAAIAPSAQPYLMAVNITTLMSAAEQQVINAVSDKNIALTKEVLVSTIATWLFPEDNIWKGEDKVIKVAKMFLRAAESYGGKESETLSLRMANGVVRNWMTETLLGIQPRKFIAQRIISDRLSGNASFNSADYLWPMLNIQPDDMLDIETIPVTQRRAVRAMWHDYIREDLPVLAGSIFNNAVQLSFTDYKFLALCSGAELLSAQGIQHEFSAQETIEIGAALWQRLLSGSISLDLLPYFITPALWFAAWIEPETVRAALLRPEKDYAQIVIPLVLDHWRAALTQLEKIEASLYAYLNALNTWSSKGSLATKLLETCSTSEIISSSDSIDPQGTEKEIRWRAKELYLRHDTFNCHDKALPVLTQEYERLTINVVKTWQQVDEILITGALSVIDTIEKDFIFAAGVVVRSATLNMRTHKAREPKIGKQYKPDVIVGLDRTVLFSVTNNQEERIYGLKRGEKIDKSYAVYRLDRDVGLYIRHSVLTHKSLWKEYYRGRKELKADGYRITFDIEVAEKGMLIAQKGKEQSELIYWLSEQYRNTYYTTLYHSGDDKSELEKIWNFIKHIIPFYSCLEGLVSGQKQQVIEALPDCFIDVLLFIPLVGQSAALSGRFGLGVARGVRNSVLKSTAVVRDKSLTTAVLSHVILPNSKEIGVFLKNTLRGFDPGLELLFRGSNHVVRLLRESLSPELAAKLQKFIGDDPVIAIKPYESTRLVSNGLEVHLMNIGQERWAVVNPQTGEAFGKYYKRVGKKSEKLEEYNRPGDPEQSNSAQNLPMIEKAIVPVGYNQLPPTSGKEFYWRKIRNARRKPMPVFLPINMATIHRQSAFLPEPQLWFDELFFVNHKITLSMHARYQQYPWRAYAGTAQPSADEVPPWIVHIRQEIVRHAEMSLQTFENVNNRLRYLELDVNLIETDVGKYLSGMLGTQQSEILIEACIRLKKNVRRSYEFLTAAKDIDFSNFVIISSDLIPVPGEVATYKSLLDINDLNRFPYASVFFTDPESRVFIYADVFGPYGRASGLNAVSVLTEDITHEVTHLSSYTEDVFHFSVPAAGTHFTAKDYRQQCLTELNSKDQETNIPFITEKRSFQKFWESIQIAQGEAIELDAAAMVDAILADPMLLANLMMTDAEINSIIIRDLAADRPFDSAITNLQGEPEDVIVAARSKRAAIKGIYEEKRNGAQMKTEEFASTYLISVAVAMAINEGNHFTPQGNS
ncbi:hypothetical protein ACQYRI_06945 [Salmonella enterica]